VVWYKAQMGWRITTPLGIAAVGNHDTIKTTSLNQGTGLPVNNMRCFENTASCFIGGSGRIYYLSSVSAYYLSDISKFPKPE
jgi:hypothetical protein